MERIAILFTFWKNQSDIKFKGGFFWRVILKEKLIVRNYQESRLEKTRPPEAGLKGKRMVRREIQLLVSGSLPLSLEMFLVFSLR